MCGRTDRSCISCSHIHTHARTHAVAIDASKTSDQEYKKEIDRLQGGMKESYARQLKHLDRTLDVRT